MSYTKKKHLTKTQIRLATTNTVSELEESIAQVRADIDQADSDIQALESLLQQRKMDRWALRTSESDHKLAIEFCDELTREKKQKSAYAKVKRLAAKYGLTIHNEGYHDGYWRIFDAWCESPEWIPVEDDIYHKNEGCFDGWHEVLTKVQFYADYADKHGISINK